MRILMINHFPLEGSGSGTYTKNLAAHLGKLGHAVCIVYPENSPETNRFENVTFAPVFFTNPEHPQPVADQPEALPFNFPCFTTHPRSDVAFADLTPEQLAAYLDAFRNAISAAVREFSPDVIHGQHVWILPSLAAGATHPQTNTPIPLVLTAHGTDLMGYDQWPSLRPFADAAMDAAARVICISADNEALVRQIFPAHTNKIVRMRNGYNPDIFHPMDLTRPSVLERYGLPKEAATAPEMILFAGKMTNFKGVDVLLDAAALYEPQLPDAITVLAGDGTERAKLEAQAERLGLKRVFFIGNVSQDELARLYAVASVSVTPSRREPFGLVAVEAMACGTPVVATNQGGLPDFVNDAVGCLVEPEDAAGLAGGIQETLARVQASPQWRAAIARYARENYSQEAIIHELEAVYHSVL